MEITRQSEYYGIEELRERGRDLGMEQLSSREVADLCGGPSIPVGSMARESAREKNRRYDQLTPEEKRQINPPTSTAPAQDRSDTPCPICGAYGDEECDPRCPSIGGLGLQDGEHYGSTGRERYRDMSYTAPRDRGREEHERQDLEEFFEPAKKWWDEFDNPDPNEEFPPRHSSRTSRRPDFLDEDYPDDPDEYDYYGRTPEESEEYSRQLREKNPDIWGGRGGSLKVADESVMGELPATDLFSTAPGAFDYKKRDENASMLLGRFDDTMDIPSDVSGPPASWDYPPAPDPDDDYPLGPSRTRGKGNWRGRSKWSGYGDARDIPYDYFNPDMPGSHHRDDFHPDHRDVPQETVDYWEEQGVPVAWDRGEHEPCERGTPGCSVHHPMDGSDTSCETW